MGCDFEVLGSTDETAQQEGCLRFLASAFSSSSFPDSRHHYQNVRRLSESSFPHARVATIRDDYVGDSPFAKSQLRGLELHREQDRFTSPMTFVFDNQRNGTLCQPEERERDFDARTLVLRPGSLVRIPTGAMFWYITFLVVRQRFIPNLSIEADYDVDFAARWWSESGADHQVLAAEPSTLPALARNLASQLQGAYDCKGAGA